MKRSIFSPAIDKRSVRIAVFLFIIVVALLLPFVNYRVNAVRQIIANHYRQKLSEGIERDKANALDQVKSISEDSEVQKLIINNADLDLAAVLAKQMQQHQLSTIAGVNGQGVALARVPFLENHGDLIALTKPWGRAAMEGKSLVTVGKGRSYPLVITAAHPFTRNGVVAGAVYGGYLLNDEYASRLKSTYLSKSPRSEIIIYSKTDGLMGTSIDNTEVHTIIASHFNQGTDFTETGIDSHIVRIGNKEYVVKNIPLTTSDSDEIGGVLLLLPRSQLYQQVIISLGLTLLFAVVFLRLRKKPLRKMSLFRWILLGLVLVVFYTVVSVIYTFVFQQRILNLGTPSFPIYNSVLGFSPNTEIISGDPESGRKMTLQLASGGEPINAVQAIITYDPAVIAASEITFTESLCRSDLITDQKIDNAHGTVIIGCGLPTPGFGYGVGTVAKIAFKPVKEGQSTISFDKKLTKVLANDGLGTNVLRATAPATIRVVSAPVLEEASSENKRGELTAPLLYSDTHPNSASWVSNRTVKLTWLAQDGADYLYKVDRSPNTVVTTADQETSKSELLVDLPEDGEYYIHVAARRGATLSNTAHLRFLIDTTAPDVPTIKASKEVLRIGETVRFQFSSNDLGSGLQEKYYFRTYKEGKEEGTRLPVDTQLSIPFNDVGRYVVEIRVFDNAGNASDANIVIQVNSTTFFQKVVTYITSLFH